MGRIFHGSIADAASAIAGSLRGKLRLVMAAARRLSLVVTAREFLGPAEKRAGKENAGHEEGDDCSHGDDSALGEKHLNLKG
jgi:hypothetical protein